MDQSNHASIEYPMKPGSETTGSGLTESGSNRSPIMPYKGSEGRQSAVGAMLAHPFAAGFLLIVAAEIFMPSGNKPHDHLGTAIGTVISREQEAHTVATGKLVETQTRATVVPQSQVETLRKSQEGLITMGQLGDMACVVSSLFGEGRSSAHPELRDGLRAGCSIGAAIRENVVREQGRLLEASR